MSGQRNGTDEDGLDLLLARSQVVTAAVAGLAALVVAVVWLQGSERARPVALVLLALAVTAAVAVHLTRQRRTRSGAILTSAVFLASVPILAHLYAPAHGVTLLVFVAYLYALPHLRGWRLTALAVVSVMLAAYATTVEMLLPGESARALEILATAAGSGAAACLAVLLAWQLHRSTELVAHRYENLLAQLPVGVVRAEPDTRIAQANAAFAALVGRDPSDPLLDARLADILPEIAGAGRVRAALDAQGTVSMPTVMRAVDGTLFPVRIRATLTPHGDRGAQWIDAVLEDATQEVREAEARGQLAAIVDSATDAILGLRPDGTIRSWNAGATAMLGWTDGEMIGRSVLDVTEAAQRGMLGDMLNQAARGVARGPDDIVCRSRAGDEVTVSVLLSPIHVTADMPSAIAFIARDVTAQRRLEATNADLVAQRMEARRLEAIGRLAGGIAHDFNNLLTGILGYADILHPGQATNSEVADAARQITRAAREAAVLTRQLLSFTGQGPRHLALVDLVGLLRDQVPALAGMVGHQIDLSLETVPDRLIVHADRTELIQVVTSLVLNARNAIAGQGSIHLQVRIEPPEAGTNLDAPRDEGMARLDVGDTGTGIPPDVLPLIFEPFFSTKEGGRGSGLGLSVVQSIAHQSGGRIAVRTSPEGTTVSVWLPLADSQVSADLDAVADSQGPRTILVVDDDPIVRRVTLAVLEKAGYNVVEAASGREAAGIDPAVVDLVVTDVMMPGIHGPDLAALLRSRRPDLPVILMSGFASSEVSIDLLGARTRFIEKPFVASTLLAAVAAMLAEVELPPDRS